MIHPKETVEICLNSIEYTNTSKIRFLNEIMLEFSKNIEISLLN
ncbi:MAG: hypothetical protein QW611_06615 [Ignisphaera sp.]